MILVKQVITGGQCGADIGATNAAYDLKILTGGYMPKNFQTEKGPMPKNLIEKFKFIETDNLNYSYRTRLNVQNADVTFLFGELSGGTKLTLSYCLVEKCPSILINSLHEMNKAVKYMRTISALTNRILTFERKQKIINNNGIILNVAGNRESKNPGIAEFVYYFMKDFLKFYNNIT